MQIFTDIPICMSMYIRLCKEPTKWRWIPGGEKCEYKKDLKDEKRGKKILDEGDTNDISSKTLQTQRKNSLLYRLKSVLCYLFISLLRDKLYKLNKIYWKKGIANGRKSSVINILGFDLFLFHIFKFYLIIINRFPVFKNHNWRIFSLDFSFRCKKAKLFHFVYTHYTKNYT